MNKIIGITGLAGDGKDSVCNILEKFFKTHSEYSFQRMALADELKIDCRDALIDMFDVDPVNCSRIGKEKIRPFLVFYGKLLRGKSKGRHWTNIINKKLSGFYSEKNIFCVPDVRYAEYPEDEAQWVKSHAGVIIHVTKYSMTESLPPQKIYTSPVNREERENDPRLKQLADYFIEWQGSDNLSPENDSRCIAAVEVVARKILETI